MLYKLNPSQYSDVIDIAVAHDCGSIYPLSIAEGIQEGDIFTNSDKDVEKVLFWAHSSFAYLSGNIDGHFMEDIYEVMSNRTRSNTRRFLLLIQNQDIQNYFKQKKDIIAEKRYLFKYSGSHEFTEAPLPVGYRLEEINVQLLEKISGKIVPSLFGRM